RSEGAYRYGGGDSVGGTDERLRSSVKRGLANSHWQAKRLPVPPTVGYGLPLQWVAGVRLRTPVCDAPGSEDGPQPPQQFDAWRGTAWASGEPPPWPCPPSF